MEWGKLTKGIKRILKDKTVQEAFDRAGNNYENKIVKLKKSSFNIDELISNAREIRSKIIEDLDSIIETIRTRFEEKGVKVFLAKDKEEAQRILLEILGDARLIVKGKSMVTEELELREFLAKHGYEVWETDVGEFLIQIAKDKPMHMITPSIHYTREKAAKLLSKFFRRKFDPNDVPSMVMAIREFLREKYFLADVGILGANVVAAEDASVVVIHNEGNLRFIASTPKKLVIITDITKVAHNLEEAIKISFVISRTAGYKIAGYIDILSNFKNKDGLGPEETYLILVDNGRSKMLENEETKEIAYCLRCGACMYVCPVYRVLGRVYGGPTYMGGIGLLISYFIEKDKKHIIPPMYLCLDCNRCLEVCPTKINAPYLLKNLRTKES